MELSRENKQRLLILCFTGGEAMAIAYLFYFENNSDA
jgi:hypothetical protein